MEVEKAKKLISSLIEINDSDPEKIKNETLTYQKRGVESSIREMDVAFSLSLNALCAALQLVDVCENSAAYCNALNENEHCADIRISIMGALCSLSKLSCQKKERVGIAMRHSHQLFDQRYLNHFADELTC